MSNFNPDGRIKKGDVWIVDGLPDDVAPGRSSHPVLAPANGSAPALNREQIEILDHTERRAAGGFYCGGGKEMDALVTAGLMEYAGRKSFVPDPYYRITGRGRDALKKRRTIQAQARGE